MISIVGYDAWCSKIQELYGKKDLHFKMVSNRVNATKKNELVGTYFEDLRQGEIVESTK